MRIDVLTLFPELFDTPLRVGLLGKAVADGTLAVFTHNYRDATTDRHRTVDDAPYGGGAGMVMKCDVAAASVERLRGVNSLERVVLLTPRGRRLTQSLVREWAAAPDLALLCARYEGMDERVSACVATDEVSIGDYVLSGGELPALVIIEAISRMLPGVVGDWESVETDSFYKGILGPPQYTRPPEFEGLRVPEVLLSGDHAAIARWRHTEALRVTRTRRPDLLGDITESDNRLLSESARGEGEEEKGR